MNSAILFAGNGWRASELHQADVPLLQAFLDANPEYFLTIGGEGPKATSAQEEFDSAPPPEFPRLGVVLGNVRAERFWQHQGYAELRRRHDIPIGLRSNTVRVLLKPLQGGTTDEYLALVGRDRPDAP